MIMINRVWILLCLLLAHHAVTAQDNSAIADANLVSSYLKDINSKVDRLDQKLDKFSAGALKKLQKQENDLKRKLVKKDSVKSGIVFGNAEKEYTRLEQRIQNVTGIQQYIPSLDTLTTSLKFLRQNPQLGAVKKTSENIGQSLKKLTGVGREIEKAEVIKRFLKERKQYLNEQLQSLGFAKELKKINKQAYYHSEQLNEYKSLLKDHRKAERKVLALLSKSKLFNNFMRKNSMLASLFRLPDDPDNTSSQANLMGLQTRTQVNGLIQQQIAAGGPNAQQQFQQNIQSAQAKMNELKDKITRLDGISSDVEIPEGFKPNKQKTKSFFKRLEWGTNIQSQKANSYFPVISDIGLSLGYKLNDKSVLGIGASYKIGWGKDIRHISITHQGVGVRSFLDWKIKGSFWMSGGYELNYGNAFKRLSVLKDLKAWSQSSLLGVSKMISLKAKYFTKTKFQLFWDFLSYQQVPGTQPVVFRIGYAIK
jgi:hypothetical protein